MIELLRCTDDNTNKINKYKKKYRFKYSSSYPSIMPQDYSCSFFNTIDELKKDIEKEPNISSWHNRSIIDLKTNKILKIYYPSIKYDDEILFNLIEDFISNCKF
jgi:hypothetical protein